MTDRSLDRQLAAATTPFDLVYERHALFSSSAMRFARCAGCLALLEVNAPLVEEQLCAIGASAPRAPTAWQEALCAPPCESRSPHGVVDGHRAYGLDHGDFLVCPNGVDPARFAWDIPTARTRETRGPCDRLPRHAQALASTCCSRPSGCSPCVTPPTDCWWWATVLARADRVFCAQAGSPGGSS
ncbi:MAG: hypothetical protein R3E53_15155 [Myxococcota bacterium]